MDISEIKNIYPTLDLEVIDFEVENKKYYANIVTYFSDALKQDLHFLRTYNEKHLMKEYLKYEDIYVSFFQALYAECKIYKFIKEKLIPYNDFPKLEHDIRYGIQEHVSYNPIIYLIPSEELMILAGFDLKLIFYWKKSDELSPKIIKMLTERGIEIDDS